MKRVTIISESGKPLQFGDIVETDSPLKAEQRSTKLIADAIKAYRMAAKDLLKGKFACYAEFMPQHLQNPISILVIRCHDGVFVRYDAATNGDAQLISMASNEGVAEVALKLSDSFVHFGRDAEHLDEGENSPRLRMTVVGDTGAPRETFTFQLGVFTTGQLPDDFPLPKPPARPICLVSVTNEVIIEAAGLVGPADAPQLREGPDVEQFLAHGRLQLPVAWRAIEIYPLLGDECRQVEYAPAWAELDILAIAAQRNMQERNLNALDPRAETRRKYTALLAEFESLLQGPEEPLHQFLLKHPELISPTCDKRWSKVPFGATKSDFVFREPHNDYELVEIESPDRQLFRQDGQQHGDLTHAINQISDWVRYIEDNKRTVEVELGLSGISTNPRRLVVIGRSKSLTDENRRKLTTIQNEQPKLRILTYDDLLAGARANLERILGPLDLTGQNVKLYFFK